MPLLEVRALISGSCKGRWSITLESTLTLPQEAHERAEKVLAEWRASNRPGLCPKPLNPKLLLLERYRVQGSGFAASDGWKKSSTTPQFPRNPGSCNGLAALAGARSTPSTVDNKIRTKEIMRIGSFVGDMLRNAQVLMFWWVC